MTIEEFKHHYESTTGQKIPSNGNCRCPAHDDRSASLSVKQGDDGRILLHCHAGCETKDVCAKLGLKLSDLMPANKSDRRSAPPLGPGGKKVHPDMQAAARAALWSIQQRQGEKAAALSQIWEYRDDVSGEVYAAVVRINLPTTAGERGRKEFRPLRKVDGGWQIGDPDRWLPYRIESINQSETLHVVEGEKCADALAGLGYIAVTSAHGAKSPHKMDWKLLAGKTVFLWPDNDDVGKKYIENVGRILADLGCKLRLINLPGLPEHGDIADWIASRPKDESDQNKKAALDKIINGSPEYNPPAPRDGATMPAMVKPAEVNEPTKIVKPGIAEALITFAEKDDFFHDAEGAAYVCFECENGRDAAPGKHRQTWRIDSKRYKQFLSNRYYTAHKRAPDDAAIANAISTLEHKALGGQQRTVGVRRIHDGGKIYLDLADAAWNVIEIDASGWRCCRVPPVNFLRKNAMLPLPMPERSGNIDDLRCLVNVPDDDQWILIKGWLLSAFNGEMPLPMLAVNGEQGSAKSTLCKVLRMLIDPNLAPLRSFPKDERDLMVNANNNLILAFDNLSGLPPAMADALCRLSTGAGFSTRALYSDGDESIFSGKRSIIINGIEDLAGRADLLDRSITIQLPAIPDERRKNEKDIQAEFQRLQPKLLGALLTAVSSGLANEPGVKLQNPPRMADFARWAVAGESAMGIPPGKFIKAYRENIRGGNEAVLESSPIFEPLVKLLETAEDGRWQGTAGELLKQLAVKAAITGDDGSDLRKPPTGWPANARALRGKLTRIAPNLRRAGIEANWERTNKARLITLSLLSSSKLKGNTVTTVTPSPIYQKSGLSDDFSSDGRKNVPSPTVTNASNGKAGEPDVPSPKECRPSLTVTEESAENQAFLAKSDGVTIGDGIAGESFLAGTAGKSEGVL